MFGRILGPNAKAHDSEISGIMRDLWGKNFTTYRTPEWAAIKSISINAPGLSFYGASTLEELFAAMGGKDVMNGFLNRWLILPTDKRSRGKKPMMKANVVPKGLSLALAECRIWAHRVTTEMIAAPIGSFEPKKQMTWGPGFSAKLDIASSISTAFKMLPRQA